MQELLIGTLDFLGMAYWVEVKTEQPKCTYYFGPFLTEKEASLAQTGYIEDLEAEATQGIKVEIKRCHPQNLTIFDDREENQKYSGLSRLTGQVS